MRLLFCIGLSFISFGFAKAQTLEVISAGGDYNETAGGSISSTIGEVMIETQEGASYHLTQGFQQPNLYVLGVQNFVSSFNVSVYPNPTTDFINITATQKSTVRVYDNSGKLILEQVVNEVDQISFSAFESGIYTLVFLENENQLKTIRVVVQ